METLSKNKRVDWIDMGKGISMIIVILYHTEIYYLGEPRSLTAFLIPPLMNFFFFLSGFFFLKGSSIDVRKKLFQILRTIVIPYVIFASAIYIPKALKWGDGISINNYIREVLLGQASWFVMALMIGQILMLLIYKLKTKLMICIGLILYVIYMIFSRKVGFQPFYYMEGIRALFFLILGHAFYNSKYSTVLYCTVLYIAPILLLVSLYCINYFGIMKNYKGLIILMTSLVGLQVFSLISKGAEKYCHKWLNISLLSIGKNSLVYYFLNGGVISVIIIIANRFITFKIYNIYLIAIISLIIISIATKLILKFCPMIVGRKNK